jgi:hypothetical protein
MMEQKMQEQIEGALYHQNEFYDEISKCTKQELSDMLLEIEYKISVLIEYGIGDSDSEKEIWFLNRDYKIIKEIHDKL